MGKAIFLLVLMLSYVVAITWALFFSGRSWRFKMGFALLFVFVGLPLFGFIVLMLTLGASI
jgi:hypothetical protein